MDKSKDTQRKQSHTAVKWFEIIVSNCPEVVRVRGESLSGVVDNGKSVIANMIFFLFT